MSDSQQYPLNLDGIANNSTFSDRKTLISSSFLLTSRFKGYRCRSLRRKESPWQLRLLSLSDNIFLCSRKWKGVQVSDKKWSLLIATKLTSICCVYKENIVKNYLYSVAVIQIQKVAIYNSDRKIINLISNTQLRYYNLKSSIIFRHIRK